MTGGSAAGLGSRQWARQLAFRALVNRLTNRFSSSDTESTATSTTPPPPFNSTDAAPKIPPSGGPVARPAECRGGAKPSQHGRRDVATRPPCRRNTAAVPSQHGRRAVATLPPCRRNTAAVPSQHCRRAVATRPCTAAMPSLLAPRVIATCCCTASESRVEGNRGSRSRGLDPLPPTLARTPVPVISAIPIP
jgi:hypothetical protein